MLNFSLIIPGVAVPTMKVPASGHGLPPLCLDQLVSIPEILSQNLFQPRVQRGIDEPLVECQDILHHAPVTFCFLVSIDVIPAHVLQSRIKRTAHSHKLVIAQEIRKQGNSVCIEICEKTVRYWRVHDLRSPCMAVCRRGHRLQPTLWVMRAT